MERPLLLVIALAFFAAALVAMAATSRIVFAMSRDERFPAHGLFRRVGRRTRTPIPATLLVLALGVVLMAVVPGAALLQLILTGAILMFLPYGMTIVLYLSVRSRLDRQEGAWDLGRWEMPVAVAALLWVVVALVVAIATSPSPGPLLIVAGLILVGGVYFAYLLVFRRHVLTTPRAGADPE